MEASVKQFKTNHLKNYIALTKPGILFGNIITASAGFMLASKGWIHFSNFILMLIGLSFVIGSGCVFNNFIDRDLDAIMNRTKKRPLVTQVISNKNAIVFASLLVILGFVTLAFGLNYLTATLAMIGFVIYVLFYSFLKYRTSHGTLIGSIAGATPPLIGYCAVTNECDLGGLLLFLIVAMWQMPHFFAIAIYRLEDYVAGKIPVLPYKKGIFRTKINMLVYILVCTLLCISLTLAGYTGLLFLSVMTLLGIVWSVMAIKGFNAENDQMWAKKMFLFSLINVMAMSFVIPFSILQS